MLKSTQVINHGWDHSDYFQGCGVSFTRFTHVVTGCGSDAKGAFEDAVDQAYQLEDLSPADRDKLPVRPRGIRKSDKVPAHCDENVYWYVSIRMEIKNA